MAHHGVPFRLTAYDGSTAGPSDAGIHVHLRNERGLRYILTAPGDLGMARAYVMGDVVIEGIHPGDPYAALLHMKNNLTFTMPGLVDAAKILRGLGISKLVPPPLPPQEHVAAWRRVMEGARHSLRRDAGAISHHYDISNRFYELVLGPSMTYTCAVYPTNDATLEEAQAAKYDLVCRKLGLQPGQRLLDIGSGWGGMVRHAAKHYGVEATGVTLSQEQALWAEAAIKRDGLEDVAEVRFGDYRNVAESGFDALSSIGLTEHIGVKNYPSYFAWLGHRLRPGGQQYETSRSRRQGQGRPIASMGYGEPDSRGESNGDRERQRCSGATSQRPRGHYTEARDQRRCHQPPVTSAWFPLLIGRR